jgi:hypothetical protein
VGEVGRREGADVVLVRPVIAVLALVATEARQSPIIEVQIEDIIVVGLRFLLTEALHLLRVNIGLLLCVGGLWACIELGALSALLSVRVLRWERCCQRACCDPTQLTESLSASFVLRIWNGTGICTGSICDLLAGRTGVVEEEFHRLGVIVFAIF